MVTSATKLRRTRAAQARASKTQVELQPFKAPPDAAGARLLSKAQVVERVGLSYPTLWKLQREGRFPRARLVGSKVFWMSTEIDAWIAKLPFQKYKGDCEEVA